MGSFRLLQKGLTTDFFLFDQRNFIPFEVTKWRHYLVLTRIIKITTQKLWVVVDHYKNRSTFIF